MVLLSFYNIYKTDTSPESDIFKSYVSLKETQKDETFLDPETTTEQKSNIFKEELIDISITLLVEFIIEVIIECIFSYEKIQKKKVKLDFKEQFETFIKNTDTNQELNIGFGQGIIQTSGKQSNVGLGNGAIMNHYIELKKLFIKKSFNKAPMVHKKIVNDLYKQKKDIIKTDLINHFKAEKTQQIIENLHSIGVIDTQDKGEKLIEKLFSEKQSPKYLFIILGLVGFATLLKFNVLAGAPITGSGTI